MSVAETGKLEEKLKSFDAEARKSALETLAKTLAAGETDMPAPQQAVNMHCHTFYSYNPEDYSPSLFAWLAKKRGLLAAGIIDFDVLDGIDEFLDAGELLELKCAGGMETRVFVPEFSSREINSPGEPGIAYHVGAGMPSTTPPEKQKPFLDDLKEKAQNRNRQLIARVNRFTDPLELDFEDDVAQLTPNGNATERHICEAYARKAAQIFSDPDSLAEFWADKLGSLPEDIDLPSGPKLQALIRKKTMKQGGVGYVKPESDAFPTMAEVNQFILACGGIPALTWLNGLSEGEQAIEELLDLSMKSGVSAINIIPDRNYTRGIKDEKLRKLNEIVELAKKLDLPVIIGTEMNSPGLKFVDDFEAPELAALKDTFIEGAVILYAHSILERHFNMGYCSSWAQNNFPQRRERNIFYRKVGQSLNPAAAKELTCYPKNTAAEILAAIEETRK